MAVRVIPTMCLSLALATMNCYGDTAQRDKYTPIQYLKNYALSSCIANGYQSEEVINDALEATDGYKEFGSLSIDAYNEAADLARVFLSKTYMNLKGENLILMKCIDFFHSEELDRLARTHAKRKQKYLQKHGSE